MSRDTSIKVTMPVPGTDIVLDISARPAFKDDSKSWSPIADRSILYVDLSPKLDTLLGVDEGTPMYSMKGEANQGEWDRWNKREVAGQEIMLWHFTQTICRKFAPQTDDARREADAAARKFMSGLRFSRKAGCSCGCSPGWIMNSDESPELASIFYFVFGAGVTDDKYRVYRYWIDARFTDEPNMEGRLLIARQERAKREALEAMSLERPAEEDN